MGRPVFSNDFVFVVFFSKKIIVIVVIIVSTIMSMLSSLSLSTLNAHESRSDFKDMEISNQKVLLRSHAGLT